MFFIRLVARREEKFAFWFAVLFSGLAGTAGIYYFLLPML